MTHPSTIPASEAEKRHPKIWLSVKIILPLVMIVLGAFIMLALIKTAPKASRKPPARTARLVEVKPVVLTNARAVVSAMGVVLPSREITLTPQVSGAVLEISPDLIPGSVKRAGDVLVKIDPADYDIARRRAESDLEAARGNLILEQGQQAIARKEFELLGHAELSPEERALILREPQQAAAQARLDNAAAALDQARLNLERTTVTAPFNAVIAARHVDLGAQVSPATPLVVLTGADAYWIEATVPVQDLNWLTIPVREGDPGSPVRIYNNADRATGAYREGVVLRKLNSLESGGRMARLLIEIRDPLRAAIDTPENNPSPLILGDFVRVEIEGAELTDIVALDRGLLRGFETAWIMNDASELEMRRLDIAFRGAGHVLVRGGIAHGERLVLTDLAAPVPGMKLTTKTSGGDAP